MQNGLWGLLGLCLSDVLSHKCLQKAEGERASLQDFIVECPDVKTFFECVFGFFAKGAYGKLTHLVGDGLTGPCDISIDFHRDVVHGERCVLGHVVDCFLT